MELLRKRNVGRERTPTGDERLVFEAPHRAADERGVHRHSVCCDLARGTSPLVGEVGSRALHAGREGGEADSTKRSPSPSLPHKGGGSTLGPPLRVIAPRAFLRLRHAPP